MIVNSICYRKIKSALADVPGAPGSSQLGEAMAAGWGFPSYYWLKNQIESNETDLLAHAPQAAFDPLRMMARLTQLGVEAFYARDIAATMLHILEGHATGEWIERFPDMRGSIAHRKDAMPERWRESVKTASGALMRALPGMCWRLPLAPFRGTGGSFIRPDDAALSHVLRTCSARGGVDREMAPYEVRHAADSVSKGGCPPEILLASAVAMAALLIPPGATDIHVDPSGIYINEPRYTVCLAWFG